MIYWSRCFYDARLKRQTSSRLPYQPDILVLRQKQETRLPHVAYILPLSLLSIRFKDIQHFHRRRSSYHGHSVYCLSPRFMRYLLKQAKVGLLVPHLRMKTLRPWSLHK